MPPASGSVLSGANAEINLAVIGLRDGLAIAAAREQYHEVCAVCDIRGNIMHTKKFAKEIVELLFGFRLKELKHHVGRLLLDNQFGGTHVWHIIDNFDIKNHNNCFICQSAPPKTIVQPENKTNNNDGKAKGITPKQKEKFITYIVKRGDTLTKIAKKHKVTIADIKKWNNLKNDFIREDQKLKIKQ